jgi:hypothetical protein
MRTLFVTSVSIVTTIMLANLQKRVLDAPISKVNLSNKNTALPHQKNGQMPIGNARFGDQASLDATLSFWQLDAFKDNTHQL